jgi:hypothetical protein
VITPLQLKHAEEPTIAEDNTIAAQDNIGDNTGAAEDNSTAAQDNTSTAEEPVVTEASLAPPRIEMLLR